MMLSIEIFKNPHFLGLKLNHFFMCMHYLSKNRLKIYSHVANIKMIGGNRQETKKLDFLSVDPG